MYIADLHIHSRYSRATSRDCTPEYLDLWARRKGIHIVGSGDFTHPAWREELKEKLEPAEDGLYTLKEEFRIKDDTVADTLTPRFVITGEISSIYKKNGRVRKVHSLILLPGLEQARLLAEKLAAIGNLHSDGRPILGLDCHDLLEIALELCPEAVYVPAHIWTPHFSLFGAFSGFDTVEECFGDLSSHIHAMETGLSSDPPMNWRVSALDKYQLISNSDAHSPAKLGREANLLDIELSYDGLRRAVQEGHGLAGTIEFFPEEGKYHFDGHRKCSLCLTPSETEKFNGICPVCGKKITIGVSHRVEQLADRPEGFVRENAKWFESMVPLPEVIGASVGHSAASAKVQREYLNMLCHLGPEFAILRDIPLEEIRSLSGQLISEGIGRLREGKVERIPGFDGEYGTVKLFESEEIENTDGQMNFLDLLGVPAKQGGDSVTEAGKEQPKTAAARKMDGCLKHSKGAEVMPGDLPEEVTTADAKDKASTAAAKEEAAPADVLNREQEQAVRSTSRRIAVIAGPGTGKTKTLISHILYLLEHRKVKPSQITAVTFTNQAAAEMKERLQRQLGKRRQLRTMQIGTFHAICLSFLQGQGLSFTLIDEMRAKEFALEAAAQFGVECRPGQFLEKVSLWKSRVLCKVEKQWQDAFAYYQESLRDRGLLDFDDLMLDTLGLIETGDAQKGWEKHFSYLLVDEFQDINPLQYSLMRAWNLQGRELFVIGDPDQSIYGFRGADARCFARMKQEYEDMETISLVDNYRSSPQILAAATEVISRNPGDERILKPNRRDNVPVRLVKAGSEMGEAIFVSKEINRLTGGIGMLEAHEMSGRVDADRIRGFEDIAVLYRTHKEAKMLEKCLKKEGIPYVVAGREDFLREDKVRGCICFFKSLLDEQDSLAREQCQKLLWDLQSNAISDSVFENLAEKYRPLCARKKPEKILKTWMEEMHLEENESMRKLLGMTLFHKNMAEFLQALSLGVESDLKRCGDKQYASDAVTLMTLHGSKGLEFPVTIIYGVRKGAIPFENEYHTADTEEERRLFYVGMTRAREELILTTSGEESEFVSGLPEAMLTIEKADKRKREISYSQLSLF